MRASSPSWCRSARPTTRLFASSCSCTSIAPRKPISAGDSSMRCSTSATKASPAIWLLHLQGITHLGLGRPEAAAAVYLRAEQLSEQLGIGEPCVVPWAGRAAIAHARAGRNTDATRVLDWLDACAERLPCRYPGVAAAFGCAELAIRHADHRAAEHHYLEALALHDAAELPMERTSTLLAYGDMLRRNGEPSRARSVFAEALHTAEAVGAPALARYAREGLSSTGGRRRRGAPDGRLTPQELRIARLIQAGSSRREIAERLTVSEATVRTHLQHIYTKLEIHSARELMIANVDQLAGNDTECRTETSTPTARDSRSRRSDVDRVRQHHHPTRHPRSDGGDPTQPNDRQGAKPDTGDAVSSHDGRHRPRFPAVTHLYDTVPSVIPSPEDCQVDRVHGFTRVGKSMMVLSAGNASRWFVEIPALNVVLVATASSAVNR